MDVVRAVLLAEADGHHFHQAALIPPAVGRVRLDTVEEEDAVGGRRVAVDADRAAAHGAFPDLDRVHAAEHRAAHGFLRDAVAGQTIALTLARRAAVAAHGRDDERLRAAVLQELDDRAREVAVAVDPAAAAGERDAHSGPDAAAQRGAA